MTDFFKNDPYSLSNRLKSSHGSSFPSSTLASRLAEIAKQNLLNSQKSFERSDFDTVGTPGDDTSIDDVSDDASDEKVVAVGENHSKSISPKNSLPHLKGMGTAYKFQPFIHKSVKQKTNNMNREEEIGEGVSDSSSISSKEEYGSIQFASSLESDSSDSDGDLTIISPSSNIGKQGNVSEENSHIPISSQDVNPASDSKYSFHQTVQKTIDEPQNTSSFELIDVSRIRTGEKRYKEEEGEEEVKAQKAFPQNHQHLGSQSLSEKSIEDELVLKSKDLQEFDVKEIDSEDKDTPLEVIPFESQEIEFEFEQEESKTPTELQKIDQNTVTEGVVDAEFPENSFSEDFELDFESDIIQKNDTVQQRNVNIPESRSSSLGSRDFDDMLEKMNSSLQLKETIQNRENDTFNVTIEDEDIEAAFKDIDINEFSGLQQEQEEESGNNDEIVSIVPVKPNMKSSEGQTEKKPSVKSYADASTVTDTTGDADNLCGFERNHNPDMSSSSTQCPSSFFPIQNHTGSQTGSYIYFDNPMPMLSLFPEHKKMIEDKSKYNPVTAMVQEFLKQQMEIIHQDVQVKRQLTDFVWGQTSRPFKYTTLEETKAFIAKHRPKPLTFSQAKKIVHLKEQMELL